MDHKVSRKSVLLVEDDVETVFEDVCKDFESIGVVVSETDHLDDIDHELSSKDKSYKRNMLTRSSLRSDPFISGCSVNSVNSSKTSVHLNLSKNYPDTKLHNNEFVSECAFKDKSIVPSVNVSVDNNKLIHVEGKVLSTMNTSLNSENKIISSASQSLHNPSVIHAKSVVSSVSPTFKLNCAQNSPKTAVTSTPLIITISKVNNPELSNTSLKQSAAGTLLDHCASEVTIKTSHNCDLLQKEKVINMSTPAVSKKNIPRRTYRKKVVYENQESETSLSNIWKNKAPRKITAKMKTEFSKQLETSGLLSCPVSGCHQSYITLANFITHYKWCIGKSLQNCIYCKSSIMSSNKAVLQHMEVEHPDKLEEYKANFPEVLRESNNQNLPETGYTQFSKNSSKPSSKRIRKQKASENTHNLRNSVLNRKLLVRQSNQKIKKCKEKERFNKIKPIKGFPKFNITKKYAKYRKKSVLVAKDVQTSVTKDNKSTVTSDGPSKFVLNTEKYQRYVECLPLTRDWGSKRKTYSKTPNSVCNTESDGDIALVEKVVSSNESNNSLRLAINTTDERNLNISDNKLSFSPQNSGNSSLTLCGKETDNQNFNSNENNDLQPQMSKIGEQSTYSNSIMNDTPGQRLIKKPVKIKEIILYGVLPTKTSTENVIQNKPLEEKLKRDFKTPSFDDIIDPANVSVATTEKRKRGRPPKTLSGMKGKYVTNHEIGSTMTKSTPTKAEGIYKSEKCSQAVSPEKENEELPCPVKKSKKVLRLSAKVSTNIIRNKKKVSKNKVVTVQKHAVNKNTTGSPVKIDAESSKVSVKNLRSEVMTFSVKGRLKKRHFTENNSAQISNKNFLNSKSKEISENEIVMKPTKTAKLSDLLVKNTEIKNSASVPAYKTNYGTRSKQQSEDDTNSRCSSMKRNYGNCHSQNDVSSLKLKMNGVQAVKQQNKIIKKEKIAKKSQEVKKDIILKKTANLSIPDSGMKCDAKNKNESENKGKVPLEKMNAEVKNISDNLRFRKKHSNEINVMQGSNKKVLCSKSKVISKNANTAKETKSAKISNISIENPENKNNEIKSSVPTSVYKNDYGTRSKKRSGDGISSLYTNCKIKRNSSSIQFQNDVSRLKFEKNIVQAVKHENVIKRGSTRQGCLKAQINKVSNEKQTANSSVPDIEIKCIAKSKNISENKVLQHQQYEINKHTTEVQVMISSKLRSKSVGKREGELKSIIQGKSLRNRSFNKMNVIEGSNKNVLCSKSKIISKKDNIKSAKTHKLSNLSKSLKIKSSKMKNSSPRKRSRSNFSSTNGISVFKNKKDNFRAVKQQHNIITQRKSAKESQKIKKNITLNVKRATRLSIPSTEIKYKVKSKNRAESKVLSLPHLKIKSTDMPGKVNTESHKVPLVETKSNARSLRHKRSLKVKEDTVLADRSQLKITPKTKKVIGKRIASEYEKTISPKKSTMHLIKKGLDSKSNKVTSTQNIILPENKLHKKMNRKDPAKEVLPVQETHTTRKTTIKQVMKTKTSEKCYPEIIKRKRQITNKKPQLKLVISKKNIRVSKKTMLKRPSRRQSAKQITPQKRKIVQKRFTAAPKKKTAYPKKSAKHILKNGSHTKSNKVSSKSVISTQDINSPVKLLNKRLMKKDPVKKVVAKKGKVTRRITIQSPKKNANLTKSAVHLLKREVRTHSNKVSSKRNVSTQKAHSSKNVSPKRMTRKGPAKKMSGKGEKTLKKILPKSIRKLRLTCRNSRMSKL